MHQIFPYAATATRGAEDSPLYFCGASALRERRATGLVSTQRDGVDFFSGSRLSSLLVSRVISLVEWRSSTEGDPGGFRCVCVVPPTLLETVRHTALSLFQEYGVPEDISFLVCTADEYSERRETYFQRLEKRLAEAQFAGLETSESVEEDKEEEEGGETEELGTEEKVGEKVEEKGAWSGSTFFLSPEDAWAFEDEQFKEERRKPGVRLISEASFPSSAECKKFHDKLAWISKKDLLEVYFCGNSAQWGLDGEVYPRVGAPYSAQENVKFFRDIRKILVIAETEEGIPQEEKEVDR